MKLSILLSAAAMVLATSAEAANVHPDKQRLCTEVCWTYDIGNHESCTARCKNSAVRNFIPRLWVILKKLSIETHRC
jgi:hypothetical protein